MTTRQMLPDSHRAPIIETESASGVSVLDLPAVAGEGDLRRGPGFGPSLVPDSGGGLDALADAFSEFISASGRLETSYRELQQEVAQLSQELAARNAALNASLAENEQMRAALEQIVDSMPCGVLVLDGDGRVVMINDESTRLLGLDSDCPARHLSEVSAVSGVRLGAFFENGTTGEAEQEFAQASGSGKRWLGVRKRRLFGASEQGIGEQTILILRDISAQKQAEQQREAARKSMALAEVAALLAHEIRNPLASLELFAGLVVDDPDRREEWSAHLRAGIRSLAGMVTNVLSFHSLGRMQKSELDLPATLRAAVEFTRPIADQARLQLSFADAGDAAIRVSANQGALQQVVLNLIANAIRHTEPGGRIDISVQPRGDSAVVLFADSGSGIAEEQLPHIFEPGFSGSGHSCGLGLAVCRQIVAHHGGQIRVTSALGRGTTFHVELPTL